MRSKFFTTTMYGISQSKIENIFISVRHFGKFIFLFKSRRAMKITKTTTTTKYTFNGIIVFKQKFAIEFPK